MEELWRTILGALCHQLPAHSLVAYGEPLPLCARCTGLHLGIVGTLIWFRARPATCRRSDLPTGGALWAIAIVAIAWLVDSLNATAVELWGASLYPPHNLWRLLTGLGMGIAVGACLYPILQGQLRPGASSEPIATDPIELAPPVGVATGLLGIVMVIPSANLRGLLLTLCALTTLAVSNGLLIGALAPASLKRRPAVLIVASGALLAAMEIMILLALHARLDALAGLPA